jgi:hypothetical protein
MEVLVHLTPGRLQDRYYNYAWKKIRKEIMEALPERFFPV